MRKLDSTISKIAPLNYEIMEKAKKRQDVLTKPRQSLGRLEELSIKIAGIKGDYLPVIKNKVIFTLASDQGVVEEGISAYPQEVTAQMVYNFLRGGAGINVLARHAGCKVVVVDMGVKEKIQNSKFKIQNCKFVDKKINYGTKNFAKGPAMSKEEAVKAVEVGIELVEEELKKGVDIIGTGDMGIGNTTPSAAITAVITGKDVSEVTGRGTGISEDVLKHKVKVIEQAIKIHTPDKSDGLEVLSKLGGLEIGGLAGIILAGAANRIPVVIDGFISGSAALIACQIQPQVKEHLIASHCSVEVGHKAILDYLGLKPIFNLNLRLGEGTGAALGISIVEAACKILKEMATFEEAGVSEEVGS